MKKQPLIPRDISWLSFNARVLQEAADPTVPLKNRIRFLAIHSNNLDEFFSIRIPALKAQIKIDLKYHRCKVAEDIQAILNDIYRIIIEQQNEFLLIWQKILIDLHKHKVFLRDEKNLTQKQKKFMQEYYESQVRPNIIPLFIESLPPLTSFWAKNIFLGVIMRRKNKPKENKYAIIEIPTKNISRFLVLPSKAGQQNIILLEDIIRFHLPYIFSYFSYDFFEAHLFKVTQNAEIEMDSEISTNYIESIEIGVKRRRKGKPICFLYDSNMNKNLLDRLIKWLNLSKNDSIIPRGRIRNFRDFFNFPAKLPESKIYHLPFSHPDLANVVRINDIIMQKDILLCPPYHSFNAIIDMLREAAIDPDVTTIKITAYRLAQNSKICNALINAARNGKKVSAIIELKAQFEEEANLNWKIKLEEEGVNVSVGVPNLKIHAKLCFIKKVISNKSYYYGFISTGNLNENTALVYADYCLLTSNRKVMKDVNNIFKAIEKPIIDWKHLKSCKSLLVSPISLRSNLIAMIDREIKNKLDGNAASIQLEINSLSDDIMIKKLYAAARAGVEIRMIVRGIMCAVSDQISFKTPMYATSIVDEFLEHGRIWIFHNNGKQDTFISSADWMHRNLDCRVEVAVKITDPNIKKQIHEILKIKFGDNVKARLLDNQLSNHYVEDGRKKFRSQLEMYHYLHRLAKTSAKSPSRK